MQTKFGWRVATRVGLALVVLIGTAALVSAPKSPFTKNDKAYYADENLINYVRPGLVIKIQSANIGTDGTITSTVKFSDPKGVPLDIKGIDTPGAIRSGNPSMVAAFIPKGQVQYTAYTTRSQTSPITGTTAIQAGAGLLTIHIETLSNPRRDLRAVVRAAEDPHLRPGRDLRHRRQSRRGSRV